MKCIQKQGKNSVRSCCAVAVFVVLNLTQFNSVTFHNILMADCPLKQLFCGGCSLCAFSCETKQQQNACKKIEKKSEIISRGKHKIKQEQSVAARRKSIFLSPDSGKVAKNAVTG